MSDRRADVTINVVLLRSGARAPTYATPGSTGLDIYACLDNPDGTLEVTADPVVVPTGIALEVPPDCDAQVRPRSGLARQGVMKPFGTIDSDYRGELFVTMYTVGTRGPYTVRHGDRIAQLVVSRRLTVALEVVSELGGTDRGAGGHGSTGV